MTARQLGWRSITTPRGRKHPKRYGRIQVWLPPEEWPATFEPAQGFAEGLARAEGTRTMLTSVGEDHVLLHDYTGTARSVRGQGVARALKYETVAQAIALGQQRVRTNNDAENAPILKLNAEMGYTRIPGWIQFHRAADEA